MRIFCVPAKYQFWLEADLKRSVEEIALDRFRREAGEKPSIPDVFIHPERTGDIFVVVGESRDTLVAAIETLRNERQKAKAARPRKVASR